MLLADLGIAHASGRGNRPGRSSCPGLVAGGFLKVEPPVLARIGWLASRLASVLPSGRGWRPACPACLRTRASTNISSSRAPAALRYTKPMSARESVILLPFSSIQRSSLDENVLDLAAIAAGIHFQRAADGAGHAAQKFKPGDAGIGRRPRHRARPAPLRRRARACLSVSILPKADDSRTTTPGMPPSRTRRLEPTPITETRRSVRPRREECRQIFVVGGTKQDFGRRRRRETRPDP